MKKILRITSLILAIVLCCLGLVSCNALDDMRRHHGNWTDDRDILLDGVKYVKLPPNDYFSPLPDTSDNVISVTEEGVPVLLSSMFSDGYGYFTEDKALIYFVTYTDDSWYYCREDLYEVTVARMNSEFIAEGYCYNYYDYEEETDKIYYLTMDEAEAVAEVKNTVKPTEIPASTEIYYDYTIYLYECTADLNFKKEVFELCSNDGRYCIVDNYGSAPLVYPVPDEYSSVFESIFKEYINAEGYWDEEFYYEDEFGVA